MKYEFIGKITKVGAAIPVSGKVKEKCTFVVQDDEAREIAFLLFDEAIDRLLSPYEVGDKVKVTFTVKSREYMGKWYTDCYATAIESATAGSKKKSSSSSNSWNRTNSSSHSHSSGYNEGYHRQRAYEHTHSHSQRPPWEEEEGPKQSRSTDYFAGIHDSGVAKKKYRELCLKYHPDKGGDPEIMKEINIQYDKLCRIYSWR